MPRLNYIDSIKTVKDNIFKSGNRDSVPSKSVLGVARHEANKVVVKDDNVWESLNKIYNDQQRNSLNSTIKGTLQRITRLPSGIMLWSEDSLRIYRERSKTDVVYIDATGSVLASDRPSKRPFYIYEVVVRHPLKGNAPFAVASFVSDSHNIASIKNFISQFKQDETKLFGSKPVAKLFICDSSMALIRSVLSAFMDESLESYNIRCYTIATGHATQSMLNRPFIHLCASHIIKNFIAVSQKLKKKRSFVMHCFGLLLCSDTLSYLSLVFGHLVIIFNTNNPDFLKVSLTWINTELEKKGIIEPYASKSETQQVDNEESSEYILSDHNPFVEHFDSLYDMLMGKIKSATDDAEGSRKVNSYFCPDIIHILRKNFIGKIALWTSLMLGNLDRHGTSLPYVHYSTFFSKLTKMTTQNLSKDNRTSGTMEKSQQELKRTRLRNRRYKRLDEIAIVYHDFYLPLVREFTDSLLIKKKVGKKRSAPVDLNGQEEEVWSKRPKLDKPNPQLGIYLQPPAWKNEDVPKQKVVDPIKSSQKTTDVKKDQDVIITSVYIPDNSSNRFSVLNKYPILSALSTTDFNELLQPGTWLSTFHVDFAMQILSNEFPHIDGLQSSNAYTNFAKNTYTPSGKFVQICHLHGNHWCAVSNMFSVDNNSLYVYDSYMKLSYTEEDKYHLSKLLRPDIDNIKILIPNVQQQQNSSLCGAYSIVFAIALCLNINPVHVEIKERQIRQKLFSFLKRKQTSINDNLFEIKNKKCTICKTFECKLYCFCRLAYNPSENMIACDQCQDWYHFNCINVKIPVEAYKDSTSAWFCPECTVTMR